MKSVLPVLLVLSLVSCNSSSEQSSKTDSLKSEGSSQENTATIATISNSGKAVQLPQGKLFSDADAKSYVFIDNDNFVMGYEGESDNDTGKYIIEPGKQQGDIGRLLVYQDSDTMWYYILSLSDSTLSLSYEARGNTLTYKRK